jgi:CRP-like cAMP-binding protein
LSNCKLVDHLTNYNLEQFHYSVKKKNLKRGQTIYKEGDLSRNTYYIKSGDFMLSKDITLEKNKYEG